MGVLDRFRLDGKVAVVTAGSKGIGRGIALALAEAGADILITARGRAALDESCAAIEALGRRAVGLVADATDAEAMRQVAEKVMAAFGHVDIWVNNAGGQPDGKVRPFLDVDAENFTAQVDLNLASVWAGTRAAAPLLSEGGSIITISSVASRRGLHANYALYAALKSAIVSLTTSLAAELAPRLRVNAVAPSAIPTATFRETMGVTEDTQDSLLPHMGIPLGRWGTPEDVGAAVVYLASPAGAFVTGECLYVTGGM